jgi:hypothetical protein
MSLLTETQLATLLAAAPCLFLGLAFTLGSYFARDVLAGE